MSITAVIPIKLNSERCPRKNISPFNETTLLDKKISSLREAKIPTIVNCADELKLPPDVMFVKRDPQYASAATTADDLFKCLVEGVETEGFMYAPCVAPFITTDIYHKFIRMYEEKVLKGNHTSVVSVSELHEYLMQDGKPFNFDTTFKTRSQDFKGFSKLTFLCIAPTDLVKKGDLLGSNPFTISLDEVTANDIDTIYDFTICELLDRTGLDTTATMKRRFLAKHTKPHILDCTIRDGGYTNEWRFPLEQVIDAYKASSEGGAEYFEIGFFSSRELLKKELGQGAFVTVMVLLRQDKHIQMVARWQ
jgi:CMP-N-acetylneuraminic acid synthetase